MHTSVTTTTLTCDKCGEQTGTLKELKQSVPINPRLSFTGVSSTIEPLSELCPNCWDALIDFLKPKPTV
jgi:hypothetical protein